MQSVAPLQVSVSGDGETVPLDIRTTTANCAWSAVSSVAWITVDPAGGTGSRTLALRVDPNPSSEPREGRLEIGGQRVTVTQAGRPLQGRQELRGRVAGLTGTCPALAWSMDGVRVTTDRSTAFVANSCGRLRNGVEVEVKGDAHAGVVAAKQVRIVE